MVRNPLDAHPVWRQIGIVAVLLPLLAVGVVFVFAWPAARVAPRQLPVGIVGTQAGSQQIVTALTQAMPAGFDLHLYPDEQSARAAIEHREVYGAIEARPDALTVYEASAASPVVAQSLTAVGTQLATRSGIDSKVVDVVPTSSEDPRGSVLAGSVLPLIISSVLIAATVALVLSVRPAWRRVFAVALVSAVAALGVLLVAQGFLGALPHQHLATWGALTLSVFAMSVTAAGLTSLVGTAGLGLSAVVLILLGNAFSGLTSAPELLPDAVHRIGQLLPPGAIGTLLRSVAYFDGHGSALPLTVLTAWSLFGVAAVVAGHRRLVRRETVDDRDVPGVIRVRALEPAGAGAPDVPRHALVLDDDTDDTVDTVDVGRRTRVAP